MEFLEYIPSDFNSTMVPRDYLLSFFIQGGVIFPLVVEEFAANDMQKTS